MQVLHEGDGGRRIERDGARVHRPTYPTSRWVHGVLVHLEGGRFEGAPRLLGIAPDGREMLSYVDGDEAVGWDGVLSDDGLASAALLLRAYHDAVRDYSPPAEACWSSGAQGRPAPDEVMLHGDPGPWNMIWRQGRAAALIDWDHANPGPPLDDLAYLAAYTAPLCPDQEAIDWMRHPGPPDRAHRLRVLADAYGTHTHGLVDRAAAVIAKTNRTVERMAREGLEPQRTWVSGAMIQKFWRRYEWIIDNRTALPA